MRNRRRTMLTVSMIAAGIVAIVVFEGFAHNLIMRLQRVAIDSQYGHMQIASDKTWNLSAKDRPKDRVFDADPEMVAKISALPGVAYVSGRLTFYGLVSDGEQSLTARGLGFDPVKEVNMLSTMKVIDGANLNSDSKFDILIGKGLREQIGIGPGSRITVMAYTLDGSVNALDVEVAGVFETGLAEVDNTTFYIPLDATQKLLDTSSVERLVVQLSDLEYTASVMGAVTPMVTQGFGLRSWNELAVYYRQVVEYLNTQNRIIQWILMVLALLAIGNIVGMSIAERTGEIGTVRAMGDSRSEILVQFLLEGLILGCLGGIFGCILSFLVARGITQLQIPVATPGSSHQVRMVVDILPWVLLKAFSIMCLMAVVATLIPAFKASRLEIVEALKRNV